MKVRDYIKKLEGLDQETDIFFLEENKETGDEKCFNFAVCENQIRRKDKVVEKILYYRKTRVDKRYTHY